MHDEGGKIVLGPDVVDGVVGLKCGVEQSGRSDKKNDYREQPDQRSHAVDC